MSHVLGPVDGDPVYCNVASGDFNNDGFDDILWGHPGSPSSTWFGKVYMISGGDPFPNVIDLESPPTGVVVITGHEYLGLLGYGLGEADFNGDGIDDIIMSAMNMVYAEVYVIAGSSSLLPSYWTGSDAPGMTRVIDVEPNRGTGYSLAASAIDLDGKDDLIIGAPG